jgi:hypothetical protein
VKPRGWSYAAGEESLRGFVSCNDSLDAGALSQPVVRLPQGNRAYAGTLDLSSSASPMRSPSGPRM